MKIDNCNALITGASAGIGREFARQLAGRARSLILVARREERLSELRDELMRNYPGLTVHIRKIDLANLSQAEELIAWLEREKIDVDLLINNAGLGDLGPFATSDPARNEQIMLVNVIALTSLTRGLLPQMIAKKRGAILNVSSSAGFLPIPGFAVYAATKAYVTSFSEALRAELRGPRPVERNDDLGDLRQRLHPHVAGPGDRAHEIADGDPQLVQTGQVRSENRHGDRRRLDL